MNIAEILKDCPKGTKLYSPICGECELIGVHEKCGETRKNITVKYVSGIDYVAAFDEFGRYIKGVGECVLFPSKDNRDWSNFKPIPEFKPFDKVLVRNSEDEQWSAALFSHIDSYGLFNASAYFWKYCILYEGNEHLLGTSNNL